MIDLRGLALPALIISNKTKITCNFSIKNKCGGACPQFSLLKNVAGATKKRCPQAGAWEQEKKLSHGEGSALGSGTVPHLFLKISWL